MSDLDEEEMKKAFHLMGLDSYIELFSFQGRPTLEINYENRKLLSALRQKKLIYDFGKGEKDGFYDVIRYRAAD